MHQDIDYSLKIQNFKTFTETHDDDTALKYLSENDWNEGVIKKIKYLKFKFFRLQPKNFLMTFLEELVNRPLLKKFIEKKKDKFQGQEVF
jgi:AAA15 family ATPase/GTPase